MIGVKRGNTTIKIYLLKRKEQNDKTGKTTFDRTGNTKAG
jgi:hypothetical protein